VVTLTDVAGLLMAFEPECSASVLSHAFQMLGLHKGGLSEAQFCLVWEHEPAETNQQQLLRWLP
ncbi:unnamed protein product, partial [Symbiodinium pilosum]